MLIIKKNLLFYKTYISNIFKIHKKTSKNVETEWINWYITSMITNNIIYLIVDFCDGIIFFCIIMKLHEIKNIFYNRSFFF